MRQLGKIQCLEVLNDEDAPWIILFHGYGADASDLFSLHEYIQTQKEFNWLFPQGILEVPIGMGWTGRAWWNINMQAIEEAASRGETRDMSQEKPAGLEKAENLALEMIRQLKVPWEKIILGGFSQGAMLATQLYLKAPTHPAGLVILSGTLLNQEEWKGAVTQRQGQPFFMSHGTQDSILGIKQAQQLESLLTMGGLKGSLLSFRGGHEIPVPVLRGVSQYLDKLSL
ncbi:MAG: alpha/beta hydrolase [Bdellovibrionia bacterium]